MASFVRGTIFLMVVIFLSKLLGFVYRMQFMRIAGEEAVGVYMTAYPAFIFFMSLVQIGLPIAVAKIIAELYAKKRLGQLKAVMKTATK
ncbi:polysaccharide biosynthesis protein, partial [Butyricicoccus sp. 1XD8-22]